jgi:Fe-S-cluster containining protein
MSTMPPTEPEVPLDHPRFRHAEVAVFTRRVVADCMSHRCAMHAEQRTLLDACCQYGCDVDLFERDAILARADDIRPILDAEARDARWFDDETPETDADAPSGLVVRTHAFATGCVFLHHDQRGCAIHRAGVERGWDFRLVKPSICQLFPLSYTSDAIVVSHDYADYSCAYDANAPSLYRVTRDVLGAVFGDPLVRAMDAAEARILARRLPLAQ